MFDGICGIYRRRSHIQGEDRDDLGRMIMAAPHRSRAGNYELASGHAIAAVLAMFGADDAHALPTHDDLVILLHGRLDDRDHLIRVLRLASDVNDTVLAGEAYRRWGERISDHLTGDYALAIVDERDRRLVLHRDPMGMRPLYYRLEDDRVIFASEIAQILPVSDVPRGIDREMVAHFLCDLASPLSLTFFEGIAQVEPGETLIITPTAVRHSRRWDRVELKPLRYGNEDDYAEHFFELFSHATRDRLRDSGKIAVSLSGGTDSTSITAMAAHELARAGRDPAEVMRTYSFAFEGFPDSDERHISSRLIAALGLRGSDVSVRDHMPMSDYQSKKPAVDDAYVLAYSALMDKVRAISVEDGARTMLSGYRGDLVAGETIYDYMGLLCAGRLSELLGELRLHAEWRGKSLTAVTRTLMVAPWMNHILDHRFLHPHRHRMRQWRIHRGRLELFPGWMSQELRNEVRTEHLFPQSMLPRGPDAARTQRLRAILMPFHMRGMVREERDCAFAGLRFADVWSDVRIAEFAAAVPQRIWNTAHESKRLVRMALQGIIPDSIRTNMRKIYPQPVYDRAMRETARPAVVNLLTNPMVSKAGYVDTTALLVAYEGYARGGAEPPGLWRVLCLERWLRAEAIRDS